MNGWTGPPAEFAPGGAADTHVITVCHSLLAACQGAGPCVASVGSACAVNPPLQSVPTPVLPASITDWDLDQVGVCALYDDSPDRQNLHTDCPLEEAEGAIVRPMTLPMPPSDPCEPFCSMFVDPIEGLVLHIPQGMDDLSDATLEVTYDDLTTQSAEVGWVDANHDHYFKDRLDALSVSGKALVTAKLEYIVDGGKTSNASEVIVK
jgi:hypothetical protein